MPDPATVLFFDYYDAQLFAHQLEEEGHRASVYNHGYGYYPWIAGGFRVVVFEDGLTGDPDEDGLVPEFGELPTGPIGRVIDDFVRVVTVAGVALCACIFVVGIVVGLRKFFQQLDPNAIAYVPLFSTVALTPLLVVAGLRFTLATYEGYRSEQPFWVLVMQIAGYFIVACFALPMAILAIVWAAFAKFPSDD